MKHVKNRPVWMQEFHSEHGIWPIAGGAGEDDPTPPADEGLQVDLTEGGSVSEPQTSQQVKEQSRDRSEPKYFTEDDLARVRKEEKDKLYPRLEQVQSELEELRKEREARQKAEEEAEKQKAEEAANKEREELDAKELLTRAEQEWQERFNQLQQEREEERALLEKEREFSQLQEYKQQKLSEAEDAIMPELRDLVQGNTPEEIDNAIANMQERTARILEQARTFAQQQRQQMPGVRPTAPGIGPVEENDSAQQTVSPEQIKNMNMQDYAKYRDKLLGAAKERVSQKGLYG